MLATLTLSDFLSRVADKEPVPGGGSVAALSGAVASSLTRMVANLTLGKKNYEAHQELMKQIVQRAKDEEQRFTADIDRDADAYRALFACFGLPKETDEEKAARSRAIQAATQTAALVPMEVARRACALMPLIAQVATLGNRNAVTDACVAMMSARSAVLGALLNVRINLSGIKDEAFASALRTEADQLERQACACEEQLLTQVHQELGV
ncbi:MAG: cyclodeaminase/cyclohydrolase family protein [Prevotellaceae bacterium]|jgi:formiminotetrahydrofolate cyclodeaminase|nr:cyclodeaminase/cyclohydrolase family protein [Prevotellaceae bacterium]